MQRTLATLLLASLVFIMAQPPPSGPLNGSFPHAYPGIPNNKNDFKDSKAWQKYFQVPGALKNITFSLPRSFAGNLPVNRQGHPNNTLFFWGFEKVNGSLTTDSDSEPWGIWLNGGPGSSSLLGLFYENGPIHLAPSDGHMIGNNFSWHTLMDMFWIDQPVGTGFSTADNKGFIIDEDQMGADFMGFLSNLAQVFPSLRKRPFYLLGESYAGMYIPYIAKTYFGLSNPPVNLAKFVIEDGTLGSGALFVDVCTVNTIETYPQLINYDTDVYKYFKEQTHLCGYDLNLTYPQNGTIDPWYECDLSGELLDYAANFSKPWSESNDGPPVGVDVYDIPNALSPTTQNIGDISLGGGITAFMNDQSIRSALHAPTSKDWLASFNPYPFGNDPHGNGDPSDPTDLLTELATNSSKKGVPWVIYSGNDDPLVAYFGTQVGIQNTTFGGIQGFSKPPSTPWFGDDGQFAGIAHQERNVTFVLFYGTGHLVPQYKPENALTFVREFVLGSNTTGLVNANGSIVGGTTSIFNNNILSADRDPIFTGSGVTAGSTLWPSATIDAWESFIAGALPSAMSPSGPGDDNGKGNSGVAMAQLSKWLAFTAIAIGWVGGRLL